MSGRRRSCRASRFSLVKPCQVAQLFDGGCFAGSERCLLGVGGVGAGALEVPGGVGGEAVPGAFADGADGLEWPVDAALVGHGFLTCWFLGQHRCSGEHSRFTAVNYRVVFTQVSGRVHGHIPGVGSQPMTRARKVNWLGAQTWWQRLQVQPWVVIWRAGWLTRSPPESRCLTVLVPQAGQGAKTCWWGSSVRRCLMLATQVSMFADNWSMLVVSWGRHLRCSRAWRRVGVVVWGWGCQHAVAVSISVRRVRASIQQGGWLPGMPVRCCLLPGMASWSWV